MPADREIGRLRTAVVEASLVAGELWKRAVLEQRGREEDARAADRRLHKLEKILAEAEAEARRAERLEQNAFSVRLALSSQAEPISVRRLFDEFAGTMRKPDVLRAVQLLEERGLVRRDIRVGVALTEKARSAE